MQKAIGYIRVSTQGQADEGVSLEAQRAKIRAWCELNDAELVAVFEDAGLSGASMKGREGLEAALKATGKGMALVCYSISRLARSTRDMLHISEQLDKKGADLVSLTEKIDTTTAAGRMVFKMLAVLADFERDQIGERTKLALAHKKAVGEVYGVLSRNRRKFRQPINVACPSPGRWGRPNSRVTSRHFDHGNASRMSRPDCSGLDGAD